MLADGTSCIDLLFHLLVRGSLACTGKPEREIMDSLYIGRSKINSVSIAGRLSGLSS